MLYNVKIKFKEGGQWHDETIKVEASNQYGAKIEARRICKQCIEHVDLVIVDIKQILPIQTNTKRNTKCLP